MSEYYIKSNAKINISLNITGKTKQLHKIESIVVFAMLHDKIFIKKINSKKNDISFLGKFSKNIGKDNTVSKLLRVLENEKLLKNKKFRIKIYKNIPSKAGLGGGSMNAASILKYFLKRKIIKIKKKKIVKVCKHIGSDVILGLNSSHLVLTSGNKIKNFKIKKKIYILIIKPNFGCDTKEIYSKVKKFNKLKFSKPNKKMFEMNFLKKTTNDLENIVFSKYPKLKSIKLYLENYLNPVFVRMSGSGSSLVAYYQSKERCENAKREFKKRYKNYWCITSKTI